MVRIHVMVVLASCCAALGQDLTIELERVNSQSEAVTVTQYRTFMDGTSLRAFLLAENQSSYELYFVKATFLFKDANGIPVASDDVFLDGEGLFELTNGTFTDSVPPGTIAIRQGCIACLDNTGYQRIIDEATSVVISLSS